VAHFLVNPCGRTTLSSAWDRGRCCRCDLSPQKHEEESLDQVLEEKLAKLSAVRRGENIHVDLALLQEGLLCVTMT
jgi:hypothetical protein